MSWKSRIGTATLSATITTVACGPLGPGGDVELRIENASNVTFDLVSLYTTEGVETNADVTPGETTPFVSVNVGYGIATTEVVVGTDTLRLQVIDFVGETPLAEGRYTYVLSIAGEPGNEQLVQALREET